MFWSLLYVAYDTREFCLFPFDLTFSIAVLKKAKNDFCDCRIRTYLEKNPNRRLLLAQLSLPPFQLLLHIWLQ